ncbi:hypothetical protein F4819DRAFT_483866 [Hypoxylon fuscum]|nr:hypothetical protein F4819DRAFT_483866 [Hypoxylon fuscum]
MAGYDIERLREKAQELWEDQVQTLLGSGPKTLKDVPIADVIRTNESTSFNRTGWTSGRCTSFTIRVVRQLQEYHSPSFDFKFYDLGGHHVTRYARTGILIDSSSAVEVLVLGDGKE